jgi:CheY-like chemotaxis protein
MSPSIDPAPAARLALAEDDAGLREAVAQALREHGLEVVEAADGGALIGILRRGNVSLVVTDLMMPGLRGDDVLRYYRQKGDKIPFVVITAAPAPIVEQVAKFDFVTLLRKPFTEQALLEAVLAALGIDRAPQPAVAVAIGEDDDAGD